jgi:hypothetical protein
MSKHGKTTGVDAWNDSLGNRNIADEPANSGSSSSSSSSRRRAAAAAAATTFSPRDAGSTYSSGGKPQQPVAVTNATAPNERRQFGVQRNGGGGGFNIPLPRALARAGVWAHAMFPDMLQLATMLGMIFGGCCSNVKGVSFLFPLFIFSLLVLFYPSENTARVLRANECVEFGRKNFFLEQNTPTGGQNAFFGSVSGEKGSSFAEYQLGGWVLYIIRFLL